MGTDDTTYTYSSTQINIPDPLRSEILKWGGAQVSKGDLFDHEDAEGGLEDIPHCTVLYGIRSASPGGTHKALSEFDGDVELSLGPMQVFDGNDEYDVLVISVDSPDLQRLYDLLKRYVPNSSKWPVYKPHVTVAYMKKGSARQLDGDASFKGRQIKAEGVLFSGKDGRKVTIHIGSAGEHSSQAFARGFASEMQKAAFNASGVKKMLGLMSPAKSGLRPNPATNPALAKDVAGTFGKVPGVTRDPNGVFKLPGAGKTQTYGRDAAHMSVGNPGSKYYRGDNALKMGALYPWSDMLSA